MTNLAAESKNEVIELHFDRRLMIKNLQ